MHSICRLVYIARPIMWCFPQGLANFYDKHPPSGREEVGDAIQTYQTLLPHLDKSVEIHIAIHYVLVYSAGPQRMYIYICISNLPWTSQ